VCTSAASYSPGTFGSADQGGQELGSDTQDNPPDFTQSLVWGGGLGSGVEINFELFAGGGGSNTPDWPTALGAASNVDLATAIDVLGLVLSNPNGSGQAQDVYFVTAGTLNVTSASATANSTFAGSFSNVASQHIMLTANGDLDFGSDGNPVFADSCMTAVTAGTFSTTIKAAGSAVETEPNQALRIMHALQGWRSHNAP
jgi:hypothetical protein